MKLAVDLLTDLGFRAPFDVNPSCVCDADGHIALIISPGIPGRPARDDLAAAIADLLNAQAEERLEDRRAAA